MAAENQDVKNYGVAGVQVRLFDKLPNLVKDFKKYNFDISAYQWQTFQNSPYFSPLLTEAVQDPMGTFSVCFPSKRKYVNFPNYLKGLSSEGSSSSASIDWTPTKIMDGMIEDLVNNKDNPYDDYVLAMPQNYVDKTNVIASDYLGPIWYPDQLKSIPNPEYSDKLSIKQFQAYIKGKGISTEETAELAEETEELIPMLPTVFQAAKRSGLWWGLQSSPFLTENMPFWVTLTAAQPPTSITHDTFFIISLGVNTGKEKNTVELGDSDEKVYENRFDLYLSLNKKPRLIDYYGSGATENVQKEWDMDTSRLTDMDKIEVGCMAISGRLVFSVNGETLVYNRISHSASDEGGKLKECKIAAGPVRLYGSNCQVGVHVCPMTFAPLSIFAVNLPKIVVDKNSSGGDSSGGDNPSWLGQKNNGIFSGSVAELPNPPSMKNKLYGVDCFKFSGDGGTCSPSGFGFHQKGNISFVKADPSVYSGLDSSDFYIIVMQPGTTHYAYDGCPYFFRLKGGYQNSNLAPTPSGVDVSHLVISVDETATAPDYFHIKKSATITLYNENDEADILEKGIRAFQSGVEIKWGWNGIQNSKKTFTGVITNVTTSDVAGKELLTLQCEDYMYVLKNIPIVNSPFYDGMVAAYALKDLAERGGIKNIVIEWDDINDYFLPSGYAFSKPAMRFPSSNKLFDCMIDILKRFESYMYFDENGILHLAKLRGGLFSADATSSANFTSNPTDPTVQPNIILDERRIDYSFDSTVNNICIVTLERDTRNAIVYVKSAGIGNDISDPLLFRKSMILDQPAYGELEVARNYAALLADRVFYPTLKTSFKVVGNILTDKGSAVKALDFITLDGMMFRLMSVKRAFNADDNNFTNDYECEWLGGAIGI